MCLNLPSMCGFLTQKMYFIVSNYLGSADLTNLIQNKESHKEFSFEKSSGFSQLYSEKTVSVVEVTLFLYSSVKP